MKTLLFCTSLFFLFAFSSCTTTEEIWINEDGSLRREIKIDMSALVPFMKMSDEMGKTEGVDPDSTENWAVEPTEDDPADENGDYAIEPEEEKDPVEDAFSELLKREEIDTLISLRSIFEEEMKKEGLTEEQMWEALSEEGNEEMTDDEKEAMAGLLKTLMNAQVRIKMSDAEGIYFFSLIQDFQNSDEINSGQNALSLLQSLAGEETEPDPAQEAIMKMITGQSPFYNLKKNEFRISRPAAEPTELSEEEEQSMQMMQLFMGAMEYEYLIHFPGKVKKVNLKDAEIIDRNTVRVQAPMLQTGGKNVAFDLIVKFNR
jgi:hypothetical protein